MKMRWRSAAAKAREYHRAGKITDMPSDYRVKRDEIDVKEYESQLNLDTEPKPPCLPLLDRILSWIPTWFYVAVIYLMFLYCYFLYSFPEEKDHYFWLQELYFAGLLSMICVYIVADRKWTDTLFQNNKILICIV